MFFQDQKVYQHSASGKFNFPWLPMSKAVIAVMPWAVCVSDRILNVSSYVFAWTVLCYLVCILQGLLVSWPTAQIITVIMTHLIFCPKLSPNQCSVSEHEQEWTWDRWYIATVVKPFWDEHSLQAVKLNSPSPPQWGLWHACTSPQAMAKLYKGYTNTLNMCTDSLSMF